MERHAGAPETMVPTTKELFLCKLLRINTNRVNKINVSRLLLIIESLITFLLIESAGGQIYSSEEETSDVEARRAKRLDRAKALQDSEDEGSASGGGSGNEDDDKHASRSPSKSASPEGSHHSGSESE
jgi:uncharacterized membrane protein YdbT with pleckstrin-like domain